MNQNLYSNGAVPQSNPSYPMAGLQGSTYAPPLNYNKPTEVVGGYDANINPMTGQEIPEVNFAGGGLASLVASPYRDSDVMQVKMTPREVAGLQQLAMSYGAMPEDLYDPVTGQPQFSFLKKLLPTLIGATLNTFAPGVGSKVGSLFGLSGAAASTVGTGLVVGGAYGLIEGDLKKGLQAGLGAYSGANIAQSLSAAATPAPIRPSADEMAKTRTAMELRDLDRVLENTGMTEAATRAAMPSDGLDYFTSANKFRGTPTATDLTAGRLANVQSMPGGVLGQGVKGLFTSPESRTAFGQALGGGFQSPFMQQMAKTATFSGLANALTPDPKQLPIGGANEENVVYIPGGFNPLYGTGRDQPYQLPGKYYKKTAKGLVPYNPGALAPGYADGGIVDPDRDPGGAIVTNPQTPFSPYFTDPVSDPNVAATRAYIEELNRRARNPVVTAYPGGTSGGAFGPDGPYIAPSPITRGGSAGEGGGDGSLTGSPAGDLLVGVGGQYLVQKGIEKGIGAVKDYIDTRPDAAAQKRLIEGTEIADPLAGKDINALPGAVAGVASLTPSGGTATVGIEELPNDPYAPEAQPDYNPSSSGLASIASRNLIDPLAGVDVASLPVNPVADLSSLYNVPNINIPGAAASSSGLASIASRSLIDPLAGVDVASLPVNPVADLTKVPNINTGVDIAGKVLPGIATALGAYNTAKAIESGKEGRAAFNAAATMPAAAKLLNIGAIGGPAGMLAAAAIAAIGASMVTTKEFGDKALENYWKAVDQGRGIGQTPPEELAQGFINFYRTNKNEFPGQAKYGRTGNEDFVYDMTQVINDAVKSGKVDKGANAAAIYEKAVQPWLNTMGEGPKNEDARRIQDFMMTDLINSFMQGKPISNAQVKGDKKFKIVSERPVFAGTASAPAPSSVNPFREPRELAPVSTPYSPRIIEEEPASPMPPAAAKIAAPAMTPFSEPEREYIQPIMTPFSEVESEETPRLRGRGDRQGAGTARFNYGGAVGDDYNFGFAGGGMPNEYQAGGKLLDGPGDGMSDDIPAVIRGKGVQRAALADGEFVIPADVVSHLGNGSTKAGAKKLYDMMARVRQARTGKTKQAPAVKTARLLPA